MPRLRRESEVRVTNIELFFDLVFAFAITQLSHYLLDHPSLEGGFQTAILLAMVWMAWSATMYLANWLDPNRLPVRLMLVLVMLVSMIMSAGLPTAFAGGGVAVGAAYAVIQVGRTAFAVFAVRGDALGRNFQRAFAWAVPGGVLAVGGGLASGHARELLWGLVIGLDVFALAIGYRFPGLGRSVTRDWTVDGRHVAERNEAFVMIALGESIVIIGASLADFHALGGGELMAFLLAFASTLALWWIYFDRSAVYAARAIAASPDPGRLARSVYYWIHPIMIAGIIVIAAGERRALAQPFATADAATALCLLGGSALFLFGHALFKLMLWRSPSWSRLGAIIVLGLLTGPALRTPALAVSAFAFGAVLLVVISDRFVNTQHARDALRQLERDEEVARRRAVPQSR